MMKYLLTFIILIETFFLGLSIGATYITHKQHQKSEQCIQEILDDEKDVHDFFGHKVKANDLWIHAEAAVAHQYTFCMTRRDK